MTDQPNNQNDNTNTPNIPSSQSLVDSEMSVGKGALNTQPGDEQENKEADPRTVRPGAVSAPEATAETTAETPQANWGGQFGNSVQDISGDADRRDNQQSSPGRGEFGAQGTGSTHGGHGNQYRADDVYGAQLGAQPVSSGGYAGGRPENNTGTDEYNPQGSAFGHEAATPLAGTTVDAHYQNDNASPKSPDSGFSDNYGTSSLVGGSGNGTGNGAADAQPQRNQTEDYTPSQNTQDNQGGVSFNPQPMQQQQTGDLNGRHEPGPNQEADTTSGSETRTGYTRTEGETSYQGNSDEGIGSKGGSYNDPNTPMNPAAGATSPTKDEYSRSAQNNVPAPPADDSTDYGSTPQRNAGRDNDTDRS